jgi:hypothetical protein
MENGEQGHILNFPDDRTEVYREEKMFSSRFIGVSYNKSCSKWRAQRHSNSEKTMAHNGYFDNEETAAHASDTLARNLIKNGELNHKLNFPDDHTEIYPPNQKKRK